MSTNLPSYTTPDGIAQYPRLLIPDTKFVPEGNYSVTMEFTGDDAKTLADFLDTKMEESYKEAKGNNPDKKIKAADAPYSWNDAGTLSVNFKMKASGTTKDGKKWTRKPALLNADLTPFEGAEIAGGSKLAISFTPSPFYTSMIGAGVSMRLEAVQVIEPPETISEVADYGFTSRSSVVKPTSLKDLVGGDHAYSEMTEWSMDALTASEVNDFNLAVSSSNKEVAKLAIAGLLFKYVIANGHLPPLPIASSSQVDAYTTLIEMTSAMKDTRFPKDKAYRDAVIEKVARS